MNRYIYYRVPEEKSALLMRQVRLMFHQIEAQTSVICQLSRRAQPDQGLHTWMEIYLNIPDDFTQLLQSLEQEVNLASLIVGTRYTDDFLPASEFA